MLSDGVSVTELPSALIDIEKLGMFAAPRSSAERTHTLLEQLVARHGGVAYWIAIEGERVFCFDKVGTDSDADPGFAAGGFPDLSRTGISHAVNSVGNGLVAAPDGARPTLLVPVRGRRGHSFGSIGVTLPRAATGVDVAAVQAEIEAALCTPAAAETETMAMKVVA